LLPCTKVTAQATGSTISRAEHERLGPLEATILAVEDEELLRQPVSKMLRTTGLSVIEASDGSAALDLIRAHKDQINLLFWISPCLGHPAAKSSKRPSV
jgi:PleD family two-component response regulator